MLNRPVYFYKKRALIPLFLILSLICLLASITAGSIFLEKGFKLKKEQFSFIPPLNFLKLISGTFKSFCADIYYIRGILKIAEAFQERAVWMEEVQRNFEVATTLDPGLVQGYFFAGVVLAKDRAGIEKEIRFLENGLKRNPKEWRIPYWIGFNYYQLGDYLKAVYYYQRASLLTGAPKFLKSNQPMLYYQAGKPDLGLLYLQSLQHSLKDHRQLEWIQIKLKWLQNIVYLEEKVKQFNSISARPPRNLEELIEAGLILAIPEDPFGKKYYLDKDSGRVRSKFGF